MVVGSGDSSNGFSEMGRANEGDKFGTAEDRR